MTSFRCDVSSADRRATTWWQVVFSVASAFFGVQSSRVRRRDFTHGRPLPFILWGLAMTGLVTLAIVGAVRLALACLG